MTDQSPPHRRAGSSPRKRAQDGNRAGRDGATTRSLILAAAADMFTERGYADTTTRDLADAVGIRGPSLYYHYKTKQDLLLDVCEESLRRLHEALETLPDHRDSEARLREFIRVHLATITRDRPLHAAMLIEIRALSPERRAIVINGRDAYQAMVRDIISRAQQEGVIRRDSPDHLTLALLSLLNWTIIWFREGGSMSVDELASMMANVFLEGVATNGHARSGSNTLLTTRFGVS